MRHGDLKATHVLLRAGALGAPFEARLLDLEGVRFRRRLSDRERIEALAQLNASLPDCLAARDRQRAFRRYARSLPFTAEAGAVLDEIVRRSVARRHRWSGAGCLCGAPATARNAAGRGA